MSCSIYLKYQWLINEYGVILRMRKATKMEIIKPKKIIIKFKIRNMAGMISKLTFIMPILEDNKLKIGFIV